MVGRALVLAVVGGVVVLALGYVLMAGTVAGLMWGVRDVAYDRLEAADVQMNVRAGIERHNKRTLAEHLGPVDGIKSFQEDVSSNTRQVRFRFPATAQDISAIAGRLNLVPYPLRSRFDHGLKQGSNDPDWWRPDDELGCCTLYRGQDASGKGVLLLVYNSDQRVAYAVFDPASQQEPRDQRRFDHRR